jgi:D-arabinose 1-dehydrogenase-like Zn-dependent alcohol dehydrogenase
MRAATVTAPGKVEVGQVALPQPAPGEIRIKIEGCGVCASNLLPWKGSEWIGYPLEPGGLGHESWGTIDAIGDAVTQLAVGDRVAALSGRSYAEYDIAEQGAAVKLPAQLDGQPFPGEPLGCAFNIFRRADVRAGQTVAIVGIGFLGAILTKLATDAGARVIAISRRESSLDLARHYGARRRSPWTTTGASSKASRRSPAKPCANG